MTKKIRFILFLSLVFFYLIIAPILIFYSLGYRMNFEKKKLISTGGFYLKIWPQEVNILIDDKINKKTGIFLNQILIQGLSPKKYTILVEKEGYFPWQKSLKVRGGEVTRVNNITLIKEKIFFEKLKDNIKSLYISPSGNLLLLGSLKKENNFSIVDNIKTMTERNSFSLPENAKDDFDVVFWNENSKIITLKIKNNYFLVDYNKSGVLNPKTTVFKSDENIVIGGKLTFKKGDGHIYLLNKQTNEFDNFHQANNIVFSPDKSKFLFFNNHEIFFSESEKPTEKIFLYRFSEKINDCFWLNNDYLIFNVSGKIKISEIDIRDRINTIEIPQQIALTDDIFLELKNPKIFWDEINKKLYILNINSVFVSEPLTDKNN